VSAPETWAEVPLEIREEVLDHILHTAARATGYAEQAEARGLLTAARAFRNVAHAFILAAEALGWVDPRGEEPPGA